MVDGSAQALGCPVIALYGFRPLLAEEMQPRARDMRLRVVQVKQLRSACLLLAEEARIIVASRTAPAVDKAVIRDNAARLSRRFRLADEADILAAEEIRFWGTLLQSFELLGPRDKSRDVLDEVDLDRLFRRA